MSDSDAESHEDEYLMATRKRRANAGSKMKKLIAQEVEELQSKTETLNDDELDLLFQEDAEDEDFEDGKSEENGVEYEELVEQEVASQVEDNDLLVSESEEEASEQDDESNEKELQRQESLQKKRKRKSKPPIIKRKAAKDVGTASPAEAVKKKTTYEVLKAESLLVSDRRTSKRSHVVANKLEVYEKLSLAEQKRKIIQERLKKHKEKQNEKALTQEDRLRMSLETEKLNLQSLDKYKEQEISKKQTRLAIQQRQKTKFKLGEPILRELTTSWIVTPIMEYEDRLYWDEQQRKREKKRKKYPRRQSKKKTPVPTGEDTKQENGETVVKNENQKAEMAIAHESKDPEIMRSEAINPNGITGQSDGADRLNDLPKSVENGISSNNVVHTSMSQAADKLAGIETESKEQMVPVDAGIEQKNLPNISSEQKVNESAMTDQHPISEKGGNEDKADQQDESSSSSLIKLGSLPNPNGSTVDQSPTCVQPEDPESVPETNRDTGSAEALQVSSAKTDALPAGQQASDVQKTVKVDESATPELIDDNGTEEEMILEGPAQEVSKNFVTIYNFGSDSCNFDFRTSLFGPQWQGPHSQRNVNFETICKISLPENPISSSEKSPIIPDLSFLNDFPVFGEYGKRLVYNAGIDTGKETEIEIKTQPPSGVLFSNGVRKKCYITSKKCQYFDPKNGVPYSDVEAYKVIQELQDPLGNGSEESPNPHFQWFGFGNGGVYLDTLQRPASGVPEGF